MKKFILGLLIGIGLLSTSAYALSTFQVIQGGTGSTTLSGIIIGNGTSPVNTLTIGTNLTLTGTTLNASGGGGSYPFTPTSAWGALAQSTTSILAFPQALIGSTTIGQLTIPYLISTSTATSTFAGDLTWNNASSLGYLNVGSYIQFPSISTPATPASTFGQLYAQTTQGIVRPTWQNGCPAYVIGRDSIYVAKNTSGITLNQGDYVDITGSTGNVPNIAKTNITSGQINPEHADGVVEGGIGSTSIAPNAFGCVMKLGIISGINTSAFLPDDMLYISTTTPGTAVNYTPKWPDPSNMVGVVLVSGVGNGSILYHIASGIHNNDSGTNQTSFGIGGFSNTGSRSLIFANGLGTSTVTDSPSGTKNTTFPSWGGELVVSTSTTQVSAINATSTTATSTFKGDIKVGITPQFLVNASDVLITGNATGTDAIKIGRGGYAQQLGDVSIGLSALANGIGGDGALAIGQNTVSVNTGSVAIGALSQALGFTSVALGDTAVAKSSSSFALGPNTTVDTASDDSVAIGYHAYVGPNALSAVALGQAAFVNQWSDNGIAIGNGATIGNNSTTSIAIGSNTVNAFPYSLALGHDATPDARNEIVFGPDTNDNTGFDNLYLGQGITSFAANRDFSLYVTSAGTLNQAGRNFNIVSGRSTGNKAGGDISLLTTPAGSSGSTLNSTTTRVTIKGDTGNVGIATTSPYSMLSVAGQVVAQNYVATSTTATSTIAGGLQVTGGGIQDSTVKSCSGSSALNTDSNGVVNCGSITGFDTFAWPFTPITISGTVYNSTTSPMDFVQTIQSSSTIGQAVIGSLTATSSITNKSVTSALVLNSSTGLEGAYGGATSCGSNNFFTGLSAVGASTCGTSSYTLTNGSLLNWTAASASLGGTLTANFAYSFLPFKAGAFNATSTTASTFYGALGIATTSPWGVLSVTGTSTPTLSNLPVFVIGTSSAAATTTAFIVDNNGRVGVSTSSPSLPFGLSVQGSLYASATSTLNGLSTTGGITMNANCSVLGSGGKLTTDSSGNVICAADQTSNTGYPFTPTSLSGIVYSATTSPMWFQAPVFESSTTIGKLTVGSIVSTTTTASLGVATSTPSALSVAALAAGSTQTGWYIDGSNNGYFQSFMQNRSATGLASTDWVLGNDLAAVNKTSNYIDLGINSSKNQDYAYPTIWANDSYLLATSTATGGNGIIIDSASVGANSRIVFQTNGVATSTIAMQITSGQLIGISTTTPYALLSVNPNALSNDAFSIGSTSTSYFNITSAGGITLSEATTSTSTAMTLNWGNTPPAVLYQVGSAAFTITIFNATTSRYAGSRKLVTVCNPNQTAGAITWVGVEWAGGTAPTQTTTSGTCDVWSFFVTAATSTRSFNGSTAYKVFGAQTANFQ